MKLLLLIPVAALLFSCGEKKETTADAQSRIRAMEDSVFESLTFDKRKAQALVDVYKAYANANPGDTVSAEYLFRAANVAKSMHEGEEGLRLYERIILEYPSWRRLPDVYYLKAFTIDSELGRKGEAYTAYQDVIGRFPDHPFAKDARAMMDNLQYSDEELIQRFQSMQDSATAKGEAVPAQ